MADQDKIAGGVVHRRDALGVAGAVAAFGAALGMSPSGAKAEGKQTSTGNPGKPVTGHVKQSTQGTPGPGAPAHGQGNPTSSGQTRR